MGYRNFISKHARSIRCPKCGSATVVSGDGFGSCVCGECKVHFKSWLGLMFKCTRCGEKFAMNDFDKSRQWSIQHQETYLELRCPFCGRLSDDDEVYEIYDDIYEGT